MACQLRDRILGERQNEIDLEALRWVVVLDRGSLTSEQQHEFDNWLRSSLKHQGAFHRAAAANLYLDRLGALAAGRDTPKSVPPLVTRRGLIAASAAAVGLVGTASWLGWNWFGNARGVRYATEVGATRTVALSDGSEVALNTATELFVHYTSGLRELRLTRGEALFTVARNVAQPFVVRIGRWMVRSLDSIFAVRGGTADITHITVAKGSVDMESTASSGTQGPQRLSERQEAIADRSEILEISAISSESMQRRFAWRSGVIVFDGQSLLEAVNEINRYTHRHLVISEPALAERRIVGVFRTADTDAFLSTLHDSLGIQTIATGNTVSLRSRSGTP